MTTVKGTAWARDTFMSFQRRGGGSREQDSHGREPSVQMNVRKSCYKSG
jgi:hypothetical protein